VLEVPFLVEDALEVADHGLLGLVLVEVDPIGFVGVVPIVPVEAVPTG